MAYRFRLIVLFFLSFFSLNSFSAIPLVSQWQVESHLGWSGNFPTAQLACESYPPSSTSRGPYVAEGLRCYFHRSSDGALLSARLRNLGNVCPQNSSPSGSQCICNEGYEEKDGNSCVLPEAPDPCEALAEKCETLNGSKQWIVGLRRNVSYKPFKTCTPAGLVPGS